MHIGLKHPLLYVSTLWQQLFGIFFNLKIQKRIFVMTTFCGYRVYHLHCSLSWQCAMFFRLRNSIRVLIKLTRDVEIIRIRDMETDLIYWWIFLTSMEAVGGQTPYSDWTLWHFNSMFGSSHSAKVCGCCMVFGL